MQYGYFDDQNREYVITRPDTPAPWANFLGSPEYGALISNNAGGYSFVKSGANGRILRYVFNRFDEPGRYIYLRDNADGDYWSASWQPVGKAFAENKHTDACSQKTDAKTECSTDAQTAAHKTECCAETQTAAHKAECSTDAQAAVHKTECCAETQAAAYRNECRHGMGYTCFLTDYRGIHSEASYYVPMGRSYEVWELTVRNDSDVRRELTLTGVAEFTNNGNYEQDQVNLQYSLFITRTLFMENRICQIIHGNLMDSRDSVDNNALTCRFFGLAGAPVSSYCGDRDKFLGPYRTYKNPIGVERGDLANENSMNGNSCGALSAVIALEPNEERTIAFLLGEKSPAESAEIMEIYNAPAADGGYNATSPPVIDAGLSSALSPAVGADLSSALSPAVGAGLSNASSPISGGDTKTISGLADICTREINAIRSDWEEKLSHFKVKTPCPEFDTMINTWNAYNCFMTFTWSRAASFIYCGLRNGYGYRDTVQDIQGVIHLAPEMAKEKIRFMLSAQVANGAGLPLVKFTHNAGHEDTPDDESYVRETGHPAYRADDALWLFPTVKKYISETGDLAFLNEVIPYANAGEATVYDHLKCAIQFSLDHLGPHGLPAGLHADWNDCLRLGANGESTFVALQFYYALGILMDFAHELGDEDYLTWLHKEQTSFGEKLVRLCWNKDRFIRGFTENGETIGIRTAPEANLWLNPQSWAVISGLAGEEQAKTIMDNVYERLNTPYGAIIMDPPFSSHAFDGALAVIYNAGVKENAGIFSQTQGWLILAEALMGRGERAFAYFRENAPSMQNDKAEIRIIEPYCYGQFTEGKASPHAGRSHVHWLTGTASTVMVGCVEGILGMRPDLHGIKIAPSIPKEWPSLEIFKDFRGRKLHILVENPNGRESGCTSMTVNGVPVSGNYVPEEMLTEETEIVLVM